MNPTERLLGAAEILEKRASESTPGTWEAELLPARWEGDRPAYWVKFTDPNPGSGAMYGVTAECPRGMADARYIATMHPGVGRIIASLLWREGQRLKLQLGVCTPDPPLSALADLVLAGEQERDS